MGLKKIFVGPSKIFVDGKIVVKGNTNLVKKIFVCQNYKLAKICEILKKKTWLITFFYPKIKLRREGG